MTVKEYKSLKIPDKTVVTIGNFDGVHKGHRFLIEKARQAAEVNKLKTAILTFSPHPREYFEHKGFRLITVNGERGLVFDALGIEHKIFIKFDGELSSLTPEAFVDEVLVGALNCRHVIIGENYKFGRKRAGDTEALKGLCAGRGIGIDIYESVMVGQKRVSSERIRALLAEGYIEDANNLLGAPYFTYGEIIRGRSLGRTLGFPTINQAVEENKLLPKFGVYFTEVLIEGQCYNGITNVGVCPTVGGVERSVETFLFGFGGDAYGKKAIVNFLHRHRDEIKFEGIDGLKRAIGSDKEKAADFFGQDERMGE